MEQPLGVLERRGVRPRPGTAREDLRRGRAPDEVDRGLLLGRPRTAAPPLLMPGRAGARPVPWRTFLGWAAGSWRTVLGWAAGSRRTFLGLSAGAPSAFLGPATPAPEPPGGRRVWRPWRPAAPRAGGPRRHAMGRTPSRVDRRTFLRIAGISLGVGALYRAAPGPGGRRRRRADRPGPGAAATARPCAPSRSCSSPTPTSASRPPPNPNGTAAFERAVATVNAPPASGPTSILFTGDLTHDSEAPGEPARADAALPGDRRAAWGSGRASIVPGRARRRPRRRRALPRVLRRDPLRLRPQGRPLRGARQRLSRQARGRARSSSAWLRQDLARFPATAPIVVFTHRPLFDLKPEWEWFTRDGDAVMKLLAPFENVTVLYGHIHREDVHVEGHARHLAARCARLRLPGSGPDRREEAARPSTPPTPSRTSACALVHAGPGGAARRPPPCAPRRWS